MRYRVSYCHGGTIMDTTQSYLQSLYADMKFEYDKCKGKLRILPKGYLHVQYAKKGVRMYWSHSDPSEPGNHYVPDRLSESDFPIIKGIRERLICSLKIKVLKTNLYWLEKLLKHYQPFHDDAIVSQLKEPYKTLPGFEHLLTPEHIPVQSENPIYRQYLIHSNSVGELFRSKSEMHISEMLLSA